MLEDIRVLIICKHSSYLLHVYHWFWWYYVVLVQYSLMSLVLKTRLLGKYPGGGGMLMKTVYKYLVYEERIWGHVASCGIWLMKYGSLVVNSQILK